MDVSVKRGEKIMEKYVGEFRIPQIVLDNDSGVRDMIATKLTQDFFDKILEKYKPGDLIMIELPHKLPSRLDRMTGEIYIRTIAHAKECVQCKNCKDWSSSAAYNEFLAAHDACPPLIRGTCHKMLRADPYPIDVPAMPLITCAYDYCSFGKKQGSEDT